MATVKWTPQALADLEAIGDFYAQDAPSYAQVVEQWKTPKTLGLIRAAKDFKSFRNF